MIKKFKDGNKYGWKAYFDGHVYGACVISDTEESGWNFIDLQIEEFKKLTKEERENLPNA